MKESCENCKFGSFPFDDQASSQKGYCRRYAPRPTVENRPSERNKGIWRSTLWPNVWDDDFCGEFQPRTTQDEAA